MDNQVVSSFLGGRAHLVRGVLFAIASLLVLLAAGCGDNAPAPATALVAAPTLPPTAAATPMSSASDQSGQPGQSARFAKAVLATSEMVVGDERFVIGLLDSVKGQPINYVPAVSIQFFKINGDGTATKTGDATPIYRSNNLPAGVYVSRTDFTEAGKWGAIVTITPQGG